MTIVKWTSMSALLLLVIALNGCASTPTDTLAMIETQNPIVTAAVTRTLGQAMGKENIMMGPREDAYDSIVTVLPPPLGPYETRSVAVPEIFDVTMRNNACYLVRRSTGVAYALNNVVCVVPPPLLGSTGR